MKILFTVIMAVFCVLPLISLAPDKNVYIEKACPIVLKVAGDNNFPPYEFVDDMGAVTEKYDPSPRAFLIVPLVGAFLIDLIGLPCIVAFMNFFK